MKPGPKVPCSLSLREGAGMLNFALADGTAGTLCPGASVPPDGVGEVPPEPEPEFAPVVDPAPDPGPDPVPEPEAAELAPPAAGAAGGAAIVSTLVESRLTMSSSWRIFASSSASRDVAAGVAA